MCNQLKILGIFLQPVENEREVILTTVVIPILGGAELL